MTLILNVTCTTPTFALLQHLNNNPDSPSSASRNGTPGTATSVTSTTTPNTSVIVEGIAVAEDGASHESVMDVVSQNGASYSGAPGAQVCHKVLLYVFSPLMVLKYIMCIQCCVLIATNRHMHTLSHDLNVALPHSLLLHITLLNRLALTLLSKTQDQIPL
jgi:hypothetical protein